MRLAVRKLRIDDVAKLQALVIDNFDAIEPGLTVLDARLLLGHATIDVVGVDTAGALVLGAVGPSANEEMLLRAVEAYSWCLEYPDSLARLYPSCQVSEDRPPRLLFVVERVPDAFHRKIKQFGFPEVDCVEVHHLEFDGVPAVYFEPMLRLRRGPAPARPVDAEAASEAIKPRKVLDAETPPSTPRPAARTLPVREPAPVVSMVDRQAAVAARVERPRPAPEPVVLREPEPLIPEPATEPAAVVPPLAPPEPLAPAAAEEPAVVVAPPAPAEPLIPSMTALVDALPRLMDAPVNGHASLRDLPELSLETAEPSPIPSIAQPIASAEPAEARVSFKDLAAALLGATPATPNAVEPPAPAPLVLEPPVTALTVEPAATAPPTIEPPAPLTLEPKLVLESAVEPVVAPVVKPAPAPTAAPQPRAPERPPVTPRQLVVTPQPEPTLKAEAPIAAAAPAAASQPKAAEPAKPAANALPQEFAGLNFPNDGVLTRQWMEFLNQMSSSK